MFETEAKFPADLARVRARLRELGARHVGSERQEDTFLRHPCRDLAAGDETLRLRRREAGGRTALELTYKGARLPSDRKVRREATLHLGEDPLPLLELVGFTAGPRLAKEREDWEWDGVSVALDHLPGVGDFAEVEVVGPDVAAAAREVDRVAALLGLSGAVDEPYIELARRKGVV